MWNSNFSQNRREESSVFVTLFVTHSTSLEINTLQIPMDDSLIIVCGRRAVAPPMTTEDTRVTAIPRPTRVQEIRYYSNSFVDSGDGT